MNASVGPHNKGSLHHLSLSTYVVVAAGCGYGCLGHTVWTSLPLVSASTTYDRRIASHEGAHTPDRKQEGTRLQTDFYGDGELLLTTMMMYRTRLMLTAMFGWRHVPTTPQCIAQAPWRWQEGALAGRWSCRKYS